MKFNKDKEHAIEVALERAVDRLDKKFMNSLMTQEEYDILLKALYDKTEQELETCKQI
jgi:folate-dependent tRNA-U54 methylase TrmFO/GidA